MVNEELSQLDLLTQDSTPDKDHIASTNQRSEQILPLYSAQVDERSR